MNAAGALTQWLNSPWLTLGPLALALVFPLGLVAFTVRHFMVGRVSTDRVQQVGSSLVLGSYLTEYGLWLVRPVVTTCVKLRVHPDSISWSCLALSALAAFVFSQGAFGLAGWLLLLGTMADSLDGAVARARGLSSDAGEVLDAVVDRWAEMVVYFGLAWYYRNDPLGFLCATGACAGAVVVSYSRAKGESFGVVARGGLMQRHERAFWLVMPVLVSAMYDAAIGLRGGTSPSHPRYWFVIFGLALTAVLANVTGLRRLHYIRRMLRTAVAT